MERSLTFYMYFTVVVLGMHLLGFLLEKLLDKIPDRFIIAVEESAAFEFCETCFGILRIIVGVFLAFYTIILIWVFLPPVIKIPLSIVGLMLLIFCLEFSDEIQESGGYRDFIPDEWIRYKNKLNTYPWFMAIRQRIVAICTGIATFATWALIVVVIVWLSFT